MLHADEGLRERKKRRTRQRIQRSAIRLIAARGLDKVTIEEIAEDAEVSPRTFFNYFPNKDAAVLGTDPTLPDRLAAAIVAQPADVAPLQCLLTAMLDELVPDLAGSGLKEKRWQILEQHPHLLPTVLGVGRELELRTAEAFAERLGLEPDDDYPRLLSSCGHSTARVALETHRRSGVPTEQALTEAYACLAAGLPAPARPDSRTDS